MIALALSGCIPDIDIFRSDDPADLAGDEVVCAALVAPFQGPTTVSLVGMDSGVVVDVVDPEGGSDWHQVDGLALLGTHVAFCAPKLTRIELATGLVEKTDIGCDGAADVDGGLALFHRHEGQVWGDPVRWYPSFEDAVADTAGVKIDADPYASRLGRGDGVLLSAWHSTHEIESWDAATGAALGRTRLQGFNTWVWGVSAVGDRLFVVNDGRDPGWNWNPRIAEFDAEGKAVRNLRLGEDTQVQGLACTGGDDVIATDTTSTAPVGTPGTVVLGG